MVKLKKILKLVYYSIIVISSICVIYDFIFNQKLNLQNVLFRISKFDLHVLGQFIIIFGTGIIFSLIVINYLSHKFKVIKPKRSPMLDMFADLVMSEESRARDEVILKKAKIKYYLYKTGMVLIVSGILIICAFFVNTWFHNN